LLTRPPNQVQKLAMLEDYFEEEQEEEQQQPASAVAINNGQRNQPCSAVRVLLMAKERAQCARCDAGLCVVPCFTEYRTKGKICNISPSL